MKLFCLPYAGGSATIYNSWKPLLNKDIELYPVELPGRGKKFSEPFFNSIDEAAEGVLKEIQCKLSDSPYFLFGHSMGAEIVFSLLQKIRERQLPDPEHVFFSGRTPPHLYENRNYINFSDEEFIDLLKEYDGTPKEFFEDETLLSIFLPIIKNDFHIVDVNPIDADTVKPFNIDFSIFIGKDEEISLETAKGWNVFTNKRCDVTEFTGGHFFIDESKNEVISKINKSLFALAV